MPPVVRVTDNALGHDCYPPSPAIAGSSNVFAESLQVHRLGDSVSPHVCGIYGHPRMSSTASSDVFVNSLGACRLSDSVECGGIFVQGAGTVFVN